MKDNIKSHLIRRDTELSFLEQTKAWDSKVYYEAVDALSELGLILNKAKSEETRENLLDKWRKVFTFVERHDKIKADLDRLTVEYNRLYAKYAHQVEINRNLQKEFTK